MKQVNVSLPENLFKESQEYSQDFGYRNVQELIIELLRNKVILERYNRYQQIEDEMGQGKNVKKFSSQDEAINYVRNL